MTATTDNDSDDSVLPIQVGNELPEGVTFCQGRSLVAIAEAEEADLEPGVEISASAEANETEKGNGGSSGRARHWHSN